MDGSNDSDTREMLVLTVNGVERRIDLATAALLDPKTDIFPRPRVYAVAATNFVQQQPFLAPSADCAAAFAARDLVRLEPDRFYRRAVLATLPPFPEVMRKARIRGSVLADLVVSEQGVVECVRVTPLLFATDAVIAAAKNWRFDALMIDGRRVKFAGELLFRFDDPDDAAWRDYVAMAPPLVESP